ncbi:MAG TPA: hypothetical protein VIM19_20480 [Actinomycetes bacterium]
MIDVVSDPDRWRAMSRSAAEWAAQQTWAAKVDAVEPIHGRLADRESHSTVAIELPSEHG